MIFLHYVVSIFILLFSRTFPAGSERPKFRDDYRYEKAFDSFYKLQQWDTTWHQAKIRCEAEGTELMVPDNLDEADSMPIIISSIHPKYKGVFVGIHDLYSPRTFVTLNGSSLINTILDLLWEYKEPKSSGKCVAMRRTGRLFVHPCNETLPFICKIHAKKIVYNNVCDSFNTNWVLGPTGNCYITHEEPQTWFQAYSSCTAAGGHLAILNNRLEANYIRDSFKNTTNTKMPNHNLAFLGFTDLLTRYHYRTIFGERLDSTGFADWDMKCPDPEKENTTQTDQRCGGVRRSGLLATDDCNIPAIFFCEKPMVTNNTNEVHVN